MAKRSIRRHAAGGAAETRAAAASFMVVIRARLGRRQDFMLVGAAGKFGDRAAAPQHHDPIAETEEFRHFARSDENAKPLPGEFANAGVNLALRADIHPARRLVQEQKPRSAEHFLAEHDLLLIAA